MIIAYMLKNIRVLNEIGYRLVILKQAKDLLSQNEYSWATKEFGLQNKDKTIYL